MNYYYKGYLHQWDDEDESSLEGLKIRVVTFEQYGRQFSKSPHHWMFVNSLRQIQYCRVDMMKECITGTLICPNKKNLLKNDGGFGFYMDETQVIFIDDNGIVAPILKELSQNHTVEESDTSYFLFEFLEYLIKDDIFFLQEYEKKLAELEGTLYEVSMENVTQHMMLCRRELLNLAAYYHQLMDISDILEENINGMLKEQETRLFSLYSTRVERLYDSTQVLREYAMQLRELYQAQIDIRQNKIMQFLTVVTTVFMPLTLITGWYGMNFVNMPELRWGKSYVVVITVSILLILIELWYFKRKKWF